VKLVDADLVLLFLHVVHDTVVDEFLNRVGARAPADNCYSSGNNNLTVPTLSPRLLFMVGKPELPALVFEEVLPCTRFIMDLGLLLVVFGLEDNLPPLSIILFNHAFELALLR